MVGMTTSPECVLYQVQQDSIHLGIFFSDCQWVIKECSNRIMEKRESKRGREQEVKRSLLLLVWLEEATKAEIQNYKQKPKG